MDRQIKGNEKFFYSRSNKEISIIRLTNTNRHNLTLKEDKSPTVNRIKGIKLVIITVECFIETSYAIKGQLLITSSASNLLESLFNISVNFKCSDNVVNYAETLE
jgi:hypothetical protein